MGMSAWERTFNNRVINPVMIALITHGLGLPTYAVLETTGRKTGRKRLVPVASGLDGDTFWLISGRHRLLGRGRPVYRLDGILLRRLAGGGDMLTIRVDLDTLGSPS